MRAAGFKAQPASRKGQPVASLRRRRRQLQRPLISHRLLRAPSPRRPAADRHAELPPRRSSSSSTPPTGHPQASRRRRPRRTAGQRLPPRRPPASRQPPRRGGRCPPSANARQAARRAHHRARRQSGGCSCRPGTPAGFMAGPAAAARAAAVALVAQSAHRQRRRRRWRCSARLVLFGSPPGVLRFQQPPACCRLDRVGTGC